jgi:hypothetical protein
LQSDALARAEESALLVGARVRIEREGDAEQRYIPDAVTSVLGEAQAAIVVVDGEAAPQRFARDTLLLVPPLCDRAAIFKLRGAYPDDDYLGGAQR